MTINRVHQSVVRNLWMAEKRFKRLFGYVCIYVRDGLWCGTCIDEGRLFKGMEVEIFKVCVA